MSIAEIAAGLQAVIDAVGDQRRQLVAIVNGLHRARDRFHAITASSGHRLVGETLRQQTQAAERLREVDRLLSGVPTALAEFAVAIGATVRPAAAAAAGEHHKEAPLRASPDDVSASPPVTDPPRVPAAVVRLAGRLNPWREGEDAKAYAFDDDHRHLNDEPFSSSRVKSAAHGLRPVRGGGGRRSRRELSDDLDRSNPDGGHHR